MKISDLQKIKLKENGEPLVHLENGILVRETVANMLKNVQKKLDPRMQLLVTDGYRSPTYQERYFLEQLLLRYNPEMDLQDLLEYVHKFVALPSVAGHPTGGAVDVTLLYDGQEIDMGGKIADFSVPELLPTYSPLATPEQAKMRSLLHDLMVAEGFAPFYGEWWHFSYNDREWAAFYGFPEAHYSPIH